MLSLEKVKNGLETFGYEYANNILCGHTKSKVKWVLPTGIVNVMAFEQATSYLFGFSDNGINLFPVHGDWDIADNLFIPWSEITSFKMKNGLLENEMILSTSAMKIEMKINKVVANNSWVKDNLNYTKSTHNRRERPVYGYRGGSRGRLYYMITTFEERPWDARDPH